jgi:hypothetical protein
MQFFKNISSSLVLEPIPKLRLEFNSISYKLKSVVLTLQMGNHPTLIISFLRWVLPFDAKIFFLLNKFLCSSSRLIHFFANLSCRKREEIFAAS